MNKPLPPPVVRRLTLVIETAPRARRPRVRSWRLEWLDASAAPDRSAEPPKAMQPPAEVPPRPQTPNS